MIDKKETDMNAEINSYDEWELLRLQRQMEEYEQLKKLREEKKDGCSGCMYRCMSSVYRYGLLCWQGSRGEAHEVSLL